MTPGDGEELGGVNTESHGTLLCCTVACVKSSLFQGVRFRGWVLCTSVSSKLILLEMPQNYNLLFLE